MFVGHLAANNIPGGREQLKAAKLAQRDGKLPDWIHKRHGWFQGEDGQWRREIHDDDMKLTGKLKSGKGEMKLDQAIKHDELFKAAPGLKNTTIEAGKTQGGVAEFLPCQNKIMVSRPGNIKDIAHEVAHAVQQDQQFPEQSRGASARDPNYRTNIGEREARNVEQRIKDQSKKPDLLKTAPKAGVSAAG